MTAPETVLVQRGEPPRYREGRFAWRCARTDGDDALLVSYMGKPVGFPRDAPPLYVGYARAVSGVLLVSVAPSPTLAPLLSRGRAVGRVGIIRVKLDGGWRGQEIVDSATGLRRPVFDGAALLRPPTAADVPGLRNVVAGESGDDRPAWWRSCLTETGRSILLVHVVGDEGKAAVPGAPAGTVRVRGRTGTVVQERDGRRLVSRALWWSERGATVSVRSSAFGGPQAPACEAPLDTEALVSFANELV